MQEPTPRRAAEVSPASGRMTAVMRSVQLDGPRRLRVALVRAGRVVDELSLEHGEVRVGPSERSTLVVPSLPAPGFTLLGRRGAHWVLTLRAGVSGRVVTAGALLELPAQSPGGGELLLDADARGRILLGDATVLFQLVPCPPRAARPQLPSSVLRAQQLDWPTTMVAGFSFFLHFGAVGSVYADWADRVVDDAVVVASLTDTLRALPAPPDVETAPAERGTVAPVNTAPTNAQHDAKRPDGRPPPRSPEQSNASLVAELQQMRLDVIGTLAQVGQATPGVVGRGEVPFANLDAAAASAAAVGASGSLLLGPHGGPLQPTGNSLAGTYALERFTTLTARSIF